MHKAMLRLAQAMAILGGVVLTLLIVLTCLSIIGREINALLKGATLRGTWISDTLLATGIGPVNGDFELVEAGIAFAIFAFIPLCQVTSGHATVDVFTNRLPERAGRVLRAIIEIAFAVVLVLIAWRLAVGTSDKFGNGETSFLLQFPVWWAYSASLFAAGIAALCGVYMAFVRISEAATGRVIVPDGPEADH